MCETNLFRCHATQFQLTNPFNGNNLEIQCAILKDVLIYTPKVLGCVTKVQDVRSLCFWLLGIMGCLTVPFVQEPIIVSLFLSKQWKNLPTAK